MSRYSADDYAQALVALLPSGRAWAFEPLSPQLALVTAYAQGFADNDDAAQDLLSDAFPASANHLLPEWEASLALPDPCAGPAPTVAQRRAQVVSRLVGMETVSGLDIIRFAAVLGYTIALINYAPARVGLLRAGDPLYGEAWASALGIVANQTTVQHAVAGGLHAGEPLSWWGNAVLECELIEALAAWIQPLFIYVDGTPAADAHGHAVLDADGNPTTL